LFRRGEGVPDESSR